MIKTLKIARREYLAAVRTKGFLIGLLLMPIFMGGSGLVMLATKGHVDTSEKRIAVVDRSGVIGDALARAAEERNKHEIFDKATGRQVKPAYVVEVVKPDEANPAKQRLELSDRVRRHEIHAFLDIAAGVGGSSPDSTLGRISYYAENAAVDDVRGWLEWPINGELRKLKMAKWGVDEAAAKDLMGWLRVEGLGLVTVDAQTGQIKEATKSNEARAVGVPVIMLMLMFMMIVMGAVPLLNSVMEEKTQRIAEVLLGSVKPFEFMMGKVLGGVGVSVTAALVYVVGGGFFMSRMGLASYVPYSVLPWFFGYMILAIFMLGSMFAAFGSICNDARDAQSLMMPSMLGVIIPMFVMMPVIENPLGSLATGLSLVPIFTPMLMILRISTPIQLPAWQPWAGALIVAAFTMLIVWAGGRVFRVAILMQGRPPSLRDMLRWGIRG
ncbi:MAG TPA: ABC transporter permease [bacterium]|nr:ABC transporter permease [bacterium]